MTLLKKSEFLVIAVLAGLFFWFNRTKPISTPPNTLKPHETERVVFNSQTDTVSVVTPQKTVSYEGIRHAQVSVSDQGKVTVVSKEYGLCFEPGLGVSYRTQIGVEGDIQFAYYHRFGVHAGIYRDDGIRAFLGCGYNLSRIHLSNTSIVFGVDNHKDILGLLRVRL